MSENRTVDKRKSFFIDPPLQKQIIMTFIYLGLAMVFVNLMIFMIFANQLLDYVQQTQISAELYLFIQQTWAVMTFLSIGASAFVLVSFAIYGVYYSNRIAGPIYRLRTAISQILNDEKNVSFTFRKDDYFQDLAEKMAQLIEKFKHQEK